MKTKSKTCGPSFLKQLSEDYNNKLRLPCKFLQRYREHLPKHVKLRINSGAAWVVKLESSDEEYCFCEGWSKFVEDLDLETSELLMLRFNVENATFDVSVYGNDWVERDIPILAVDSDTDHEDFGFNVDSCNIPVYGKNYRGREISTMEVDIGDDDLINGNVPLKGRTMELQRKIVSGERNYRSIEEIKSFSKLLKKQQRGSFMDIPKAFAIETGIANKRVIKLQNEEGKEWRVELPMLKDGRTRIGKGWNDFIVDNKLGFGSTCWFEFDASSGNLIVKQEVDLTKTSPSKRRGRERGRSSKGGIVPIESGNRRRESVVVPTKRGRPKILTVPMKRGRGYVYRVNC